ncbi:MULTISPECIES: EpsD family peptidyl-prolyl cis-trans isomerase [unclassified Nitrosospira]|uniref:EpsD family peptidyl-prolyl cis-trans isomerase n=1 Tax=unclassified Nitrosospira TaxID=2609267 RepID=UPI000D30B959|nr:MULTISPECIES: EpsD family peptidyl-prolyl cis-trans isomerase [unclassified Nitrosospira]PTR15085.1 EpsD family peptidyl-prolyl cis-trans isomerase [Nitrosospira sp. Nsp2]WON72601.1 EpsD family peptidyl-prolyl cis-trans isomerase [Nitrosospira sp. Is2]
MRNIAHHIISILLIPLVALGIAGCGSKEAEKQKPATQIAAKVNSGEISVHQLNYVLTRTPGAGAASAETAPKIRREVLDRLVDQELAVEKATEKKLDRSPEVLLALENARREILARAYVEQVTAAAPKPTIEEAKKYYAENPPLFAERRIYNIQEIVMPATAGVPAELRGMVEAGKPMEEIANWLKGRGIKFAAGSATRSAEQIPLELLPKIHPLKAGQSLVLEGPQTVTVMRLAGAQSAPVSEEAALPRIQQFLGNQRAAEMAKQEFKTLKANAKITYMGEFAGSDTPQTAAGPQATEAKDPGMATRASTPGGSVERGVAGLK